MFKYEIELLKMLQEMRTPLLNKFFSLMTMFGEELIVVVILAVIYYVFNKNYARKLFYVIIVSMGINGLIKNIVMMPRPFVFGEINCIKPETATGYSFPSGHTQNVSTWSTMFIKKSKRVFTKILLVLLMLIVGYSRLYLGAHYPSDVVAGIAFGVIISLALSKIYNRVENKQKLFLFTVIAFALFAVIFYIKGNQMFRDYFKIFGMQIGFWCATTFEEKYIQLSCEGMLVKRILRALIALLVAYLLKEGLSSLFDAFKVWNPLFDIIEHFCVVFASLGLCPLIFKKIKL